MTIQPVNAPMLLQDSYLTMGRYQKHAGDKLCLHGMQVWVVPFVALNADTGAPQVCLFIKSCCSS